MCTGVQKGDSGSWVINTSNAQRYTAIGSIIATSPGNAHFVRLSQQFDQIQQSLCTARPPLILSTFRALINCAHLAYQDGNNHMATSYLDEAFTPRALGQLTNGWYLPVMKYWRKIGPLRNLLLRYGASLLDDLITPFEWLTRHEFELTSQETEIYKNLVVELDPFREVEMMRRARLWHARRRKFQISGVCRVSVPVDTNPHIIEEESPAMEWRMAPPRPPQEKAQHTGDFGLVLSKKPNGMEWAVLFLPILLVGIASAAGVAGAAVLLAAEGRHQQPRDLGIGAAIGAISASLWSLQIWLIYLFSSFDWSVYTGQGGQTLATRGEVLIISLLAVPSGFARTLLSALYASRTLVLKGMSNFNYAIGQSSLALFLCYMLPLFR